MNFCTCGLKYKSGATACTRCGRKRQTDVPIAEEVPEDVMAALAEKEVRLERARRRKIAWRASPAYQTATLLQSLGWALFAFAVVGAGCCLLAWGAAADLNWQSPATAEIVRIVAFTVGAIALLLLLCGAMISLAGWFFANTMRRTLMT